MTRALGMMRRQKRQHEHHGFNADGSVRHPSNRVQQILYLRAWFDKYKRPEKAAAVSTP